MSTLIIATSFTCQKSDTVFTALLVHLLTGYQIYNY